jgi:hypothetical protein
LSSDQLYNGLAPRRVPVRSRRGSIDEALLVLVAAVLESVFNLCVEAESRFLPRTVGELASERQARSGFEGNRVGAFMQAIL